MATTTNFGWQTPDDTDLVKDGAAAIRTLGQSIDTSLMDLEGGTAGQILAKNSNTDMDFVFINNDTGIITAYSAKTDDYTIASGDEYNIFSMNNAVAKAFKIPTDATFNFAIGTEVNFFWITGAGQPTISAVTPGTTTVISTGAVSATPKLRVANSAATAIKLAANSWLVVGDIA
jgi:hypothetical protein